MSRSRERPEPRNPYRDSAILNAVLAGLIVLVTALTHGNLLPGEVEEKRGLLKLIGQTGAVPVAIAFFVLTTGFSWWRFRRRAARGGRP